MKKGACIIGQSGGPTAVINASLLGVVESAEKCEQITKVYGAINGIEGIINHQIIDFENEDKDELALLLTTPSAALGSVRYHLEHYTKDETPYLNLIKVLAELDIKYFFYIGGNDSMDTCQKLNEYFAHIGFDCSVIGIPKTIDNDLCFTDHTPGYGSAIKYIATTISEIHLDTNCYKKGRVTIVEIMGRDAGWLTAGAKLASINNLGADLIYLPENVFDVEDFLCDVKKLYETKQKALVVVGEGLKTANGEYLLKYRHFNRADDFGHLQLGGVAQVLCEIVNDELGYPIRSIELNLPQRCASHLASKADIIEAYQCGKWALDKAVAGETGKMVIMKRINNAISYDLTTLENVANKIKYVPDAFINEAKNNITDAYLEYAIPLIAGEIPIPFSGGMPRYAKLKKKII